MKNITLTFLGLIIFINLSAQTSRRIMEFSGTISDKYPIKMTLSVNDNEVLGFYYYEKFKTKILLEGQIQENKLILKESPDYESIFKKGFIGNLIDSIFTGIWSDDYAQKKLNFMVRLVNDNYIIVPEEIIKIEGIYEVSVNSKDYYSSLNLKYITDSIFCFEISNGTQSGCIGYLKNLIKLSDLSFGIFSGDLCEEIKFSVLSREILITEKNCEWHGMSCPFDGKYIKE